MRRLLVLVLLALVAGCTGGEPPAEPSRAPSPASPTATPMPAHVSPADNGAVFRLRPGATSTLRLTGKAEAPVATGSAVLLVQVVNVTGGDGQEWEIRAVGPGSSTVTGTSPRFTITVVVG